MRDTDQTHTHTHTKHTKQTNKTTGINSGTREG
jgi:hypothetical protein